MNLPVIILPIETKVRELHGKLFFSYMAALAGFEVITGDQIEIMKYADIFPKGIYLDKSVASTRVAWFKKLRSVGHTIASLDEEGLLFFSSEMYKKLRLDEEALNLVELFFCWGNVQKDAILEWFPEHKEKIFVCGNPRVDLMRADCRALYEPCVEKLKNRYGRIILINTNFAFFNHFKSKDELHNMLKSYPLSSEEGYIDGWIEHQKQGFESFYEIVPKIAERYPDHTVIVRPHPSENFAPWQKLAESHPNLVVNAEGNVHEWISAAVIMLHDNCTTAVEAFILGILPVCYRKTKGNEKYINFLPDMLSYKINVKEELYRIIDSTISGDRAAVEKIWCSENQKYIEQYISGLDGLSSVERMLFYIDKYVNIESEKLSLYQKINRFSKKRWRKILHGYREYKFPSDGYEKQKFPGLTRKEIDDVFFSFNLIKGKKYNFCIKQIVDDVYSIKKDDFA